MCLRRQQDRVRLAGVALKVEMFQQLKHGLERTSVRLHFMHCYPLKCTLLWSSPALDPLDRSSRSPS